MSGNLRPKPLSQDDAQKIAEQLKVIGSVLDATLPIIERDDEIEVDKDTLILLIHLLRTLYNLCVAFNDDQLIHGHQRYLVVLEFHKRVKKAAEMKIPGAEEICKDLDVLFAEINEPTNSYAPHRDN